jgi:hypothetical protein
LLPSQTATTPGALTPPGGTRVAHRSRPVSGSTATTPAPRRGSLAQLATTTSGRAAAGPSAGPGRGRRHTTRPSAGSRPISDPSQVVATTRAPASTGVLARSPSWAAQRTLPVDRSKATNPSSDGTTTKSLVSRGATSRKRSRSAVHPTLPARSSSTTWECP